MTNLSIERVDVLSDEGHKRLQKLKKSELINIIENITIINRLKFEILEEYGIDYKKIIGIDDEDT